MIDAIDECSKYQEFFTMIKGIQLHFPLHIFITSRKVSDMQRLYRPLEPSALITSVEIKTEDSIGDIEHYVKSRVQNLSIDATTNHEDLADTLLRRSNACFLWVRLVLDELEQVYSNESISQVLHNIPEGMVPFYERTIKAMAEKKLEKHIAKAVLIWVVASSRKLDISELSHALQLDIKTLLPSAKSAVEGLCGQLVSVDDHTGLVDLVHPTVREFLLSDAAAEFTISKAQAHGRIALTCLQLLSSPEMQPPRSHRQIQLLGQKSKKQEPSPLLDYAITQFSEHVYTASAENDDVLSALDRFFKSNVLTWIERIARKGDLHPLIRVSKNLKSYLDRLAKYRPPLSGQVQNIEGWSTDLSRIATKFGSALLQNPSSVYFLIPPLCPTGSAIFQRFAKRPDGLSVVGHSESAWDDCIASVGFGEDNVAAAVSCGESLIAVGMESGEIELYDRRDCQKKGVIQQKHPVDLVHLTEKLVSVCTTRAIILMDREGNTIWQTRLRFRCILLTSTAEAIVAVSQHGHILKWDLSTGVLLEDLVFAYRSPDDDTELAPSAKAPHVTSVSPDLELVAMGYRWGTVCMWEVASGELMCWARDDENRLVSVLLFNPNPNINLLLVIFRDHELALYETWSGGLVTSQKTTSTAGILSASCSPDGRTLATMDTHGILQIWDFESLNLLYHVLTPSTSFRILNFTSDGSSVVDIIDSGMRIWTPAALVRKNNEEDQSISDDAVHLPVIEGEYDTLRASRITALCAHPTLPLVFTGKHDGQVLAFSTKTGLQLTVLHTHPNAACISELAVGKNHIIASSDINGVVQVWNLGSGQLSTPENRSIVMQTYSTAKITQLCLSGSGEYLLVSTVQADHLYSTKDGSCIGMQHFAPDDRKIWQWAPVPATLTQKEQFFLLKDHTLTKFNAADFSSSIEDFEFQLQYAVEDGNVEVDIESLVIYPETRTLVVDARHISGYVSSSTMFLFDLNKTPSPSPPDKLVSLAPLSDVLPRYCKQFIGISERTKSFVFLHHNSWLCSADLAGLSQGRYIQHFFVPNEYMSAKHNVIPVRTVDDGIVFCLNGELAVVKNGLNFREVKDLE